MNRLIVVLPTVLPGLVGVKISTLAGAVGVIGAFLVGCVVVVVPLLGAVASVNPTFLYGRVGIDGSKCRGEQAECEGNGGR